MNIHFIENITPINKIYLKNWNTMYGESLTKFRVWIQFNSLYKFISELMEFSKKIS